MTKTPITKHERGFTKVPNTVLRDPAIPTAQKVLYAVLLSRCWGKPWCLASQARLAAETGLCERAVRIHLGGLELAGLVRPERRGNSRVNRYWIHPL